MPKSGSSLPIDRDRARRRPCRSRRRSGGERADGLGFGDPREPQRGEGLRQIEQADGRTTPVTVGRPSARATAPGETRWGRYMYFGLDDAIAFDGAFVARIEVEYFDEGTGPFGLQYDSNDCTATLNGAYAGSGEQQPGPNTWKTAGLRADRRPVRQPRERRRRLPASTRARRVTFHQREVDDPPGQDRAAARARPGRRGAGELVRLERSADRIALDNGYVHAEFDLAHPQIDVLRADFGGRGATRATSRRAGAAGSARAGSCSNARAGGAHAPRWARGPDLRVTRCRTIPRAPSCGSAGSSTTPTTRSPAPHGRSR